MTRRARRLIADWLFRLERMVYVPPAHLRVCKVEDPSLYRTGNLLDGRWIMGIDYEHRTVTWCFDDEIHPDNPRPGPLGAIPDGAVLT